VDDKSPTAKQAVKNKGHLLREIVSHATDKTPNDVKKMMETQAYGQYGQYGITAWNSESQELLGLIPITANLTPTFSTQDLQDIYMRNLPLTFIELGATRCDYIAVTIASPAVKTADLSDSDLSTHIFETARMMLFHTMTIVAFCYIHGRSASLKQLVKHEHMQTIVKCTTAIIKNHKPNSPPKNEDDPLTDSISLQLLFYDFRQALRIFATNNRNIIYNTTRQMLNTGYPLAYDFDTSTIPYPDCYHEAIASLSLKSKPKGT
jgi:hypothetical protein